MAEYLPEHQSPELDVNHDETYHPSEQDVKDFALGDKLFEKAKKHKSKYDDKWNDYYNMYRGRQWTENRPSYRHSEVVNLIFREIQANVPIQMDTRPKFEYLPMGPEDIALATIINQVCESDWIKYNWTEQITENVYDANILGTGLGSCMFDQKAEGGIGAVDIRSEDPFYCFPDPSARDVNNKAKYFIHAEPMDVDDIKAKWPNGKHVEADLIGIKRLDLFDKNKVRVNSPTDSTVLAGPQLQFDKDESPQALVVTVYIDGSFETEEDTVETPNSVGELEVKYVSKKKYPNGRKFVYANKVMLESGENYYEDGLFPYARLQNYVSQRQFWGISDIESLESPQKTFNKLLSFSLDVLTLMGNPIWVVPSSSGVDTDNLFNQPGMIVEYDGQQAPVRQEGVQLQPYVLQLIDRLKVWFDDMSGSSDVSRGVRPEGVTAASAIQSLQEASQTRIRQKSRNLDAYLQNLGQLYLSRIMQFYTSPRVFRLTNQNGTMDFFKFHVDTQVDESGAEQKFARYRPLMQNGTDGDETVVPIKGLLDVKVTTGSTLPFAKSEKESKLLNYFDRGIIDAEEVLKSSDYPNWEAVLQRIKEQQAAQAQAQAQQPPS